MQIKQTEKVGDKRVLLWSFRWCWLFSCWVLSKAIGDQLICIFRPRSFSVKVLTVIICLVVSLVWISSKQTKRSLWQTCWRFWPWTKRKIIGNEFVYVFDDEASKLKMWNSCSVNFIQTIGTDTAHHQITPQCWRSSRRHAIWNWLNHWTLLQRRSPASVQSSVCQTTSYGANHSQDQDLLSASWVKSLKKLKLFGESTQSFVKKLLKLTWPISGNISLSTLAFVQ